MDTHAYTSLILYYGRERFFHLMQTYALEALAQHPGHQTFRVYNGYALCLGNRLPEAIRELHPLQSDSAQAMGVLLALVYAHRRCKVVDKEALLDCDARLKEERKRLTAPAAYAAAVFLYLSGKSEKAREYAERTLRLDRSCSEAAVLKGWCDVTGATAVGPATLALFESGGSSIDALLGQVRYYQLHGDFEAAMAVLNRLAVTYPHLNIPLIEKMRTQLANWSWDQALDTAQRILAIESHNIEALRTRCLVLVCRDGCADASESVRTLRLLFTAVGQLEPANGTLNVSIGATFARCCGRQQDVLAVTYAFVERAVQLAAGGHAEFCTELGYQSLQLGRVREAAKQFRQASKLDDSSVEALCGLTLCQLAETGPTEQVRQQIEFLREVQGDDGQTAQLLYMTARLRQRPSDECVTILVRACEMHFGALTTVLFGAEYLRRFDADFLLQMVEELLRYAPTHPMEATTESYGDDVQCGPIGASAGGDHLALRHSLNILEAVCKACPGLQPAVYQLARTHFMCGDMELAQRTLHRLLHELDAAHTDGHLLQVQLHLRTRAFERAAQQLDLCLAHDFHVRERPLYHLLDGICKLQQKQAQAALKAFETAATDCVSNGGVGLAPAERVTLCLEMVGTYVQLGRPADAQARLAGAMVEFANTPEEGRLVLASAELALQQGHTQEAVDALKQILPGQPHYVQTKKRLAEVYLVRQKNRLAYTRCFRELVDECPGARSYVMLGNAFMTIQEPDEAINAYREAYNLDPADSYLASKLGRAYVKTHQYAKAIKYYTEASRHVANSTLRLDLAELYLKLKQYTNAEQTLLETIETDVAAGAADGGEDVARLQTRTKQLLLLARIRERSGNLQSSLSTLTEARDNQYRVQQRTSLEQSNGGAQEQHMVMAKICFSMADQANQLRSHQQAIDYCKQALKYARDDVATLTLLARLYTQADKNDECQRVCEKILYIEPNNEAASVMMADMSFRKMDFTGASYHFAQLLHAQPTYWTALTRLIEIMRRSATLPEVQPFLAEAEQHSGGGAGDPAGLNYCRGLYEWYTGNTNAALRHFNKARSDTEWGRQSIFNMIDICLNPDGDLPNEKLLDDGMGDEDSAGSDSRLMAVKTSEQLLNELKPRSIGAGGIGSLTIDGNIDDEALNHQLLACFLALAGRQRSVIEALLPQLQRLAAEGAYREHVGPIYALAAVHVVLRQAQRARNQLKRVAQRRWTFEDAEYLERCWLLLADLNVQAGKPDLALELLDKVKKHNKSCSKAYELVGQCSEKSGAHAIAAENYATAWRLAGTPKPSIGYRLALNYMKVRRFADAIDVCQQVLRTHPDFVIIRKDVLDKCRNNLRG